MSEAAAEAQLDALLLAIEQLEMRPLRWGATGASLSEYELVELARVIVAGDPEEAASQLLERRLLFRVSAPGGTVRYRSRFAEGVRLIASLRQVFPGGRWEASPSLVADFRADLRERRFARRDQPANEVIKRLADKLELSTQDVEIARALLSDWSLAAFQVRAAESILRSHSRDRGVVISAGTGSGKTLAHYLPAIVRVAREVRPTEFWTKAISVYPRNELLKDQFGEVLRYVRLVGDICGRPLRIGTLFGPTPERADERSVSRSWNRFPPRGVALGFVCPFAMCPDCNGRLIWRSADIRAAREVLLCEHSVGDTPPCSFSTNPAQVPLTRQAARTEPPDLLFTTAETLNQRMSDPRTRSALGLGQPRRRRPLLMLLDEVHTYEGISGAQAGMVFRRWRHGVGSPVRWVGLSATLRGAPTFFSQVTGVLEAAIEEVAPAIDEFETQAAEYQLILRGDPLSRTSLLSTSIQTSFLLARLLDPDGAHSRGRAGHRTFVFTDDLDVTNRLFHDLRDAEYKRLASERTTDRATGHHAFAAGQQWRIIQEIGWDLTRPLEVSRTSSQDAGVNANSQLVVATSSLEVGFDDDRVGAVVQHKSPHRATSFVQRKGRAGRTREMRPWMVTVLSDYGRDRNTYQSYERLFDPVTEAQQLPIANGYIRRIHASFAFIDWLATRFDSKSWWWWAVNGPRSAKGTVAQQEELTALIDRLLDGQEAELGALRKHLRDALTLDDAAVDAVLWQPPRSLMLELLPTLARRLATNWTTAGRQASIGRLDGVANAPTPRPLPEYLPPNLFTDLNLPEVTIRGAEIADGTTLLVEQALRHLPPGRVTRRFAPGYRGTHHWVPVPTDGDERCGFPLSEFVPHAQAVAQVEVDIDGVLQEVTVYRPWEIQLSVVPTPKSIHEEGVLPSSNARLRWHSQVIPQGEALSVESSHDPVWSEFIDCLEFYLHDQRSPITVRRFAVEAEAHLNLRVREAGSIRRTDRTLQILLRDPSDPCRPAAIGFEAEVDGMAVRFRDFDQARVASRAADASSLAAWRTAYIRDLVTSDPEISKHADTFLRASLFELYLTAVVDAALDLGLHASAANDLLRIGTDVDRFKRLLAGVIQRESKSERPEEAG